MPLGMAGNSAATGAITVSGGDKLTDWHRAWAGV